MSRINLYQTPEHGCPYLDKKMSVTQFVDPDKVPNIHLYSQLSQLGFRRSGEHIYRPSCPDCNSCISIRVPVSEAVFSKNQQRCLNRAKDFDFIHTHAVDSDEHYNIYEKYINSRHKGGDMYPATRELFRNFLLSSWANTQFLEIRHDSTLIASAVYDQLIDGISAIYCYFDPDYSRYSPGKLAILKQLQSAQHKGLSYLYLGYQIEECDKMNYKSNYKPAEQFINMAWQRIE